MSDELQRLEERIKAISVDNPVDGDRELGVKVWGIAVILMAIPKLEGMKQEQRKHLAWAADHIKIMARLLGESDERIKILRRMHVLSTREAGLGGCFIATAACGSECAPDVVWLRRFRDTVLVRTALGRGLIRSYELASPPVARLIGRFPALRRVVRGLVVRPAARVARRFLRPHAGSGSGATPTGPKESGR